MLVPLFCTGFITPGGSQDVVPEDRIRREVLKNIESVKILVSAVALC